MKAILLAGGYGTRLRPITNFVPKCLVPIKGVPLLDIWLENLTKAGIGPFLINTHYLHNKVNDYIKSSDYKDSITIAYEKNLLGTAGTIINNLDFVQGDDVMIIHADNYFNTDFKKLINNHNNRASNCIMSLIAFRSENPKSCGIITKNKKNILTDFDEKPKSPKSNLANGAIYFLSKECVDFITKNQFKDFSSQVIPNLINKIFVIETKDTLIDIGNIETYLNAQLIK